MRINGYNVIRNVRITFHYVGSGIIDMSKRKGKNRSRLVQNGSLIGTWVLFFITLFAGIWLGYRGEKLEQDYASRVSLDKISLETLKEGTYVEGTVHTTLCNYGSYNLYDHYVVNIGGEDSKQYITLLSNTSNSIELEKLPTYDYKYQDDMGTLQEGEGEFSFVGVIEPLKEGTFNYEYLESQLNTTSAVRVADMVSNKYGIRLIDESVVSNTKNLSKVLFAFALLAFVFVILPSLRYVSHMEYEEIDEVAERKKARQQTSDLIRHFFEKAHENVENVVIEHNGNVVNVSEKRTVEDMVDCFSNARYDKVYEDYIEEEEYYDIDLIQKDGESIPVKLSEQNVLFWYGNYNRMDYNSSNHIKSIIKNCGI